MRLKVGDLVTCDEPGGSKNDCPGVVFQTEKGSFGTGIHWANIHFGTFTFWLLEEEHELNNLKLLSEE